MTEVKKSQMTEEQMTALNDEQTVFALAVLMMDLHTASLMRNKSGLVNSMMKARFVIQANSGFPQRFKAAQNAIIKRLGIPPTQTVLDKATPELTDEQIEQMAHTAPPEETL